MLTVGLLGITAFLLALVLTPFIRDACRRLGLVDYPDERRKLHSHPIPLVGGIVIVVAYLGSFAAISLTSLVPALQIEKALPLLPAAAVIFLTGLLDDIFKLRPWQKLIGQIVAACLAITAGVGVRTFSSVDFGAWWSIPITILWLVACTNAFNLIDGLDGLAAGVGFFATVTMVIAAFMQHNIELALVTVPLAGCLLGFLRYNFNPASVFLGDSGSLLIGFLLGCYGALWTQKSATMLGMTAPMMAMSIPLLDVSLSIARRFLRNRPIFSADRGHIHHRLLDRGLTPRRAALVIYGLCGLAAIFSTLQNIANNNSSGFILVVFCAVTWMGIQHLGYVEFGMVKRLLVTGGLGRIIDVQLRIQQFERVLASTRTPEQAFQTVAAGSRDFGFAGVRIKIRNITFEDVRSRSSEEQWQLRIPLANSEYVNVYRDLDSNMHPMVFAAFSQTVQRTLNSKMIEWVSETTKTVKVERAAAADRTAALTRAATNAG